MRKLVVLKLDGDSVEGVRVTLEIGAEGARATTEVRGNLPPNPDLVKHYERWQSTYRNLEDFRITPIGISIGGDRTSQLNKCRFLGSELSKHLNSWLNAESFRPLKEKLLKQLTTDDTVRVLIKTSDIWLRRLPWHLWEFFEDYSKAEVALSAPEYEHLPLSKAATFKDKVKILAILGNSEGISIEKDRELLEKLPDAAPTFLVEPHRSQLNEQLWEQTWDILFFAGHSSSQKDGKMGSIYINKNDKLTINELRYALKQAVKGGLQLAIFNSCDGLGLAHQLEELRIPQIIVMREPVPDLVAQEFLKNFLTKFSSGESLYLAVRQSREKLHGIEDEYPCAIWLPVICQNPASVPPTWKNLLGPELETHAPQLLHHKTRYEPWWRSFQVALVASVFVTSSVMGVRSLGMLQSWELKTFDQMMGLRPDEGPDPRLLVVTVTEKDVQSQPAKERLGASLSDRALAQLLEKLESYQPRVIGLDIYRENPVRAEHTNLTTRLRKSDRLIAICKDGDDNNNPGVSPPPEIPVQRLGFSDVVADSDDIIRRHLLAMAPASLCNTDKSFSLQLALHYLAYEGIQLKLTPDEYFQLGSIVFKTLEENDGAYHQVDTRGHQVLLNYRSSAQVARQVTLTDVLNNKLTPEQVKDRIVLIGTSAESFHDYWLTPYSAGHSPLQQMPGVIVQAHMVSQLLSTVLDNRPLFWFWPMWGEAAWVWGWSLVGGLLALRIRSLLRLGLAGGAAFGTLYGLYFVLLIQGGWVPLIPSALALVATSGSIVAYTASQTQKPQ